MIFIVNKHRHSTDMRQNNAVKIYCGRGSPLGNPFQLTVDSSRDQVCDRYQAYFDKHKTPGMIQQLGYILAVATEGDVALECYCAPKRCHCETIKAHIEVGLHE